MEVCQCPFDPSDLPWAVSQCLFDPYRAGTKVYRAYQAGRRAARPTDNPGKNLRNKKWRQNKLTNP
jgi:hypothetical protein